MPLRPGRCYRHFSSPPYTRKEYIMGVPPPKISVFEMGNKKGQFNIILKLVTKERGQIRHNALEAARVSSNKFMEEHAGKNYHLKVVVYPHHILRENKMMAFAGADRLQDGMRLSFGKPIGTAARVKEGQAIIIIKTTEEYLEAAKKALKIAASKIPLPTQILEERIT
ncbi:MAG: 50S ribosomal protein L16 [archaeon GBS-70-058]|nr:50S ribosomal protein L16 [Candidatus Culexarchaeum nevadense]